MSSIKNIFIPALVTKIEEIAFYCCKELKSINFASNSKLQIIENGVFSEFAIENICKYSHHVPYK